MRWDIREKLIRVAKDKKTICYSELGSEFGINARQVGEVVGEISIYERRQDHPLLSAVVVLKNMGIPSKGFWEGPTYEQARKRGVSKQDFWKSELNRVYDYWQRHDT